jgi:hypothetical protein
MRPCDAIKENIEEQGHLPDRLRTAGFPCVVTSSFSVWQVAAIPVSRTTAVSAIDATTPGSMHSVITC